MLRSVKVRIYPTRAQQDYLRGQFGAVRFCYNKAIYIKEHQYKFHGQNLSTIHDIKPLISVAKKSREYAWLKNYDAISLQESVRNADKAWTGFFKHNRGYPKFKNRHQDQSSYHCTAVSCGENWVKIPKMDRIKAKIHRPIEGKVKSITLSLTTTGKYYAAILFEDGKPEVEQIKTVEESKITGVDRGLKTLIVTSNGDMIDNPRYLKKAQKNLKRKQKKLSRTQKGSRRREKARRLVAKAHEHVRHQREDYLHKASRQLADENQAVVVENLAISNMLKNHKLAESISDAGWGKFVVMLAYKLKRQGKILVKIDRFYPSSKTCSHCGHKLDELGLQVRAWTCPACMTAHDRDINAAINIRKQGIVKLKAEGLSVSARGSCVRHCESSAMADEPISLCFQAGV